MQLQIFVLYSWSTIQLAYTISHWRFRLLWSIFQENFELRMQFLAFSEFGFDITDLLPIVTIVKKQHCSRTATIWLPMLGICCLDGLIIHVDVCLLYQVIQGLIHLLSIASQAEEIV